MTGQKRKAVVFRVWKGEAGRSSDALVVLFPEESHDAAGRYCVSYSPAGGHSGADYYGVIQQTEPAGRQSCNFLREELRRIGYDFREVKRASRAMHEKRTNKPAAAKPVRTLEQVALDEFAATGEVTGLLVLADWYDENGGSAADAAALRDVAADAVKAERVRFFYRNAGYHTAGAESEQAARFRCGLYLARAEEWFEEREGDDYGPHGDGALQCGWITDDEHNATNYDIDEIVVTGWVCSLQEWRGDEDCGGWVTVESLGGIEFTENTDPWNDDFARVIKAELAAQYMTTTAARQ